MAEKTAQELLADQYLHTASGPAQLLNRFARDIAVQAGSGIKGLSVLPQGMDAAADAIRKYQSDYGPGPVSNQEEDTLRGLAPVTRAAMKVAPYVATIAPGITALKAYNKAVPMAADMAGRIRPELGGAVGALGESLPYAGFPEAAPESAGERSAYELLSKYGTSPLLDDGTTARTLAREQAANSRRYDEGLPLPEVPPSEFVGRQAEHEGAVASRMKEPAYVKARIHPSELDPSLVPPNFSAPDNGTTFVAMDPQTGRQIAHVTTVPRGGAVQAIRQDTAPDYQGQGIGRDLLSDAISDAHSKGLDFHSDTQLSVPAAKAFEKIPGALRNEDVTHMLDPTDGDVGVSNNGRPVYTVPKQVPADDAEVGEMPHFDPNSYIGSQAYAEGGAALSDIARLLAKYAPETEKSITSTGGATLGREGLKNQGYAVSTHKARQLILDNPPTAEDLAGFVHQNDDAFASDPQAHVGVWHNVDGDGKHYLDVSHVEPDFATAVKKAQANDQLAIFDLANKQEIPTDPGTLHFLHMSNLSDPQVTLDPAYYGTGMKGAEAKRGGTKTVSLYPFDIDQADIEQPLRAKTPYRVSVPASSMYDMSADPLGILSRAPSYSDAEDAIRDAGYAGYHVPEGQGLFRGQGRLFGPTPATRISPTEARLEDVGSKLSDAANSPSPRKPPIPQVYDDTGDVNDFARGGPVRMAEGGGELGAGLEDIGNLLAKYSIPASDKEAQAAHLLSSVDTTGSATYNPTTGDLHQSGYAVPHEINRSVSSDAPFSADDIHDFLTSNQDAFANPKAALHIETDGEGNHFMHVAHVEPDYEGAVAAATASGVNGIRELHTGKNLSTTPELLSDSAADQNPAVNEYLEGARLRHSSGPVLPESIPAALDTYRNQRPATAWRHGQQTVDPAQRNAFPGIYNDPRQVIADSNSKVGPEDPLLQRLFGVSRQDLSDIALSRQGNVLGVLPGLTATGQGAAAARGVMTPQNEQRLIDVLTEARGTPLYTGMTGWYSMDPLYERFRQIFGDDDAPAKYAQFNTLVGMASPGSDVGTEIARGTSAHWLHNQGRFEDFRNYAGIANDKRGRIPGFPQDMVGVPGHPYHSTAQGDPMADYLRAGYMQMESPKVPMYIDASGVPAVGFQTDIPVGDAHWSRGIGLADTRNPRYEEGKPVVPDASATTPEMKVLGPWWRDKVAAQAGYDAVPAQATAWGAFAPYTGVESAIGAPKLEILATQIGKLASRLGVSPETARDMVIRGQAGAYRSGGIIR